jgi:hypothetical protein
MFVHILTLSFNAALEAFDETPFQEFVKDKRLLSIRDHFFTRDEVPYLTLVLTYDRPDAVPAGANSAKAADESWREMIQGADLPQRDVMKAIEEAKR